MPHFAPVALAGFFFFCELLKVQRVLTLSLTHLSIGVALSIVMFGHLDFLFNFCFITRRSSIDVWWFALEESRVNDRVDGSDEGQDHWQEQEAVRHAEENDPEPQSVEDHEDIGL